MRQTILWNDDWKFAKVAEHVSAFPEDWENVTLPHTWNAVDGQDGGNDYYRGTCQYAKKFARPELQDGQRVILEFEGVEMTADVRVNGAAAAHHEDGFSTFRCDITDQLADENLITVTVDNSANDRIYPQKADFTFYGGIYRDVHMIIVEAAHFELIKDGTPGIKVTPAVNGSDADVTVETWQNADCAVRVTLAGQTVEVLSADGHAVANVHIAVVHLWDGLDDPYLYDVKAELVADGEVQDEVSTRCGVRTMDITPEGFFLNGRPYPLRGVARHQDRWALGNAITKKEHDEDMQLILDMGANFIRLAHYQHAQYFYDLCDEKGVVCWAEIPYITMHMPNGRENTVMQMRELITQCYNHPSICVWGLSNEITAAGKVTDDLMENTSILNDLAHKMDPTRKTTMAHAFMLEPENPIIDIPDSGAWNLYFGWYLGELEQNDSFFDEYRRNFPNRPVGFSEFGADANSGYHTAYPERSDYSIEYQLIYHEHILKCVEERPWLWMVSVWNMFDFAADGRNEGGKNGQNQKGLVTFDRGEKKDAYYLYQAHWSGKPMMHLCGQGYTRRAGEKTEIKVYTNTEEPVALYVNGELFEEKAAEDKKAVFSVPLSGDLKIEAKCGDFAESFEITKVDEEPEEYGQKNKKMVVNWFDADTFDPTCYSLKDTLGEISQNPVGAQIIGKLMAAGGSKKGGDVAEATRDNANLKKMMAGMKLETLLKAAGDSLPEGAAQQLNAALQKIKKPVK